MRSHLLAVLVLFLFALGQATTAELTWTGGGGSSTTDWSSPLNWGGSTPVAGDALTFPNVTNKNASNGTYPALTAFGPMTINAGGYVLSGASLITLEGGLFLNGANSAQVVMPIELEAPVAFTVSNSSGILTLTQPISGTGGVIKSGSGLLILNGSHNYTGPTIVNGGGLQVGGSLPGLIQVSSGFVVGTGAVDGVTSLNQGIAAIAPGTSSATGTLTCDGDVTLFTNDEIWFDITSTGADKLVVNGEVDIRIEPNGLYLALQSGYTPAVNTTFVLIENDGTDLVVFDAATPSNYLIPTFLLNDQRFQISFVGGTNRNDVVLMKVAAFNTSVTSFTTSDSSINYGDSVTFTAMFTGVVNGSPVSFWDGNEYLGTSNIVGSQAQFTTTTLKPSTVGNDRKITAMFEGNLSWAPVQTAILPQTVNGTGTTTGLTVSPSGSSASDALVTMTATVSGSSPTGTVTFFDGGVALATISVAANQAVHTTTTLIAGAHSLSATFNPAGGFVGSASSTVAHTVNGTVATTSTALTSSGTPVVAGTDVTFTATVLSGVTTGSVAFHDGAVTLGTVAVNGSGVAILATSGLSAGTHSITAHFLGTTTYPPSTSSALSQVITAAPDGSGSTGGDVEAGGGCGLGSGSAALILGLLMLVGLRLRRD